MKKKYQLTNDFNFSFLFLGDCAKRSTFESVFDEIQYSTPLKLSLEREKPHYYGYYSRAWLPYLGN